MPKERRIYAKHEERLPRRSHFPEHQVPQERGHSQLSQLLFMTDGATATDIPDSNTIVIVEAPTNVNKLLELVKRLDTKGESEFMSNATSAEKSIPNCLPKN